MIKTLSGHLTAVEKKAINAILEAGLTQGKVNRKEYYLTKREDNTYSVKIIQNETGFLSGKIEPKSYLHTFKVA
jgi:hypothetical protein